ncbi:uncharacterized protein [Dermacentor andersoni]|uniref:uncharacterized protein isoform X1 n=1 Tax=Dermacentor andersoni TaxID=34620 RepID=UPI0024163F7E|nr:uncharacterized protein LOC129383109 isoform X1 [Dermacentor andersoni]
MAASDLASVAATNTVDSAAAPQRGATGKDRRRNKASAAEAGKRRPKAKQRVGRRRSLAGAESKECMPPEPLLTRQSDGRDDALTTAGLSSCSLPKPLLEAASGSSQQVTKPPETPAPETAAFSVSPASPMSPPIFPECFAIIPAVRGEETPLEDDQQGRPSRHRSGVESSLYPAVIGPGATHGARRGRPADRRRSSFGLRRKQEPWIHDHPGMTAVVVAACCLLLLAVLVIVAVRNSQQERPRVGTCETPGCRKHGYNLALTMDMSASPCDDFYAHACGKWSRLYGKHIIDEIRMHAQRVTYDELKDTSCVAGSAAAFFASCVDPKGKHTDAAVARFAAWKRELGLLWPEHRQTATAHPLDVLLCLALRWNVSPLFTVRIRVEQRRPGCTIFLDRGTLNERHRLQRRSQRTITFEQIVADHCRYTWRRHVRRLAIASYESCRGKERSRTIKTLCFQRAFVDNLTRVLRAS